MCVRNSPVFKPFSGILGHFGKRKEAVKNCLEMVRVTGLEPVRQRHTPLKRACLPIPAHSQMVLNFSQQMILYHNRPLMSIENLKKSRPAAVSPLRDLLARASAPSWRAAFGCAFPFPRR